MTTTWGNTKRQLLKLATLATAGVALTGCTYDLGLGYASDGYGSSYYDCDPYSPFDSYYECDDGYGFSNIGFGGGWYDRYWYPGYGYFIFDNDGRRYNMRDNHRRYWGERRHRWYREHHGRDGRRGDGRGRGYSSGNTPDAIGWPEAHGGRVRDGDGDRRGRGDGRRGRNDGWRGGEGRGADAVPTPNPDDARGQGDRRRGDGPGRGGRWRGNNGGADAVPPPGLPQPRSDDRRGNGGQGSGGQGKVRQPAPQPSSDQGDTQVYRPAPAPREPRRKEPARQRTTGGAERPD